jgi:hypothetical protein
MDNNKRMEIILRKLAQIQNLANEMQVNLDFPIKIAARSVLSAHRKAFAAEMDFILARPKSDLVQ